MSGVFQECPLSSCPLIEAMCTLNMLGVFPNIGMNMGDMIEKARGQQIKNHVNMVGHMVLQNIRLPPDPLALSLYQRLKLHVILYG